MTAAPRRNPGRGAAGGGAGAIVAEFTGVPHLGRLRILPTTTGGAVVYDDTFPLGARAAGGRTYKTKEEAIAAARAILEKEAERERSDEGSGGGAPQLGDG